MKNFKNLFVALLALIAIVPASLAQSAPSAPPAPTKPALSFAPGSSYSFAGVYSFRTRETSACVATPVVTVSGFAGLKGVTLDVRALAGFNFQRSTATAGYGFGVSYSPTAKIGLYAGAAELFAPLGTPTWGVVGEIDFKF